jgi:hypothetical protein
VDDLVTTLLGVTCSNAAEIVGQDAEEDEDLKERDIESLGALSPDGPKEAYEFVAKTPELNGGVTVNRAKTLAPPGDGTLTVVVAGPAGALSAPEIALIQTGIDDNAEPATAVATVISATDVALTVETDVYLSSASGLTSGTVEDFVKEALLDYVAALDIGGVNTGTGGRVPWRALVGVIERSSPDGSSRPILEATLVSEADVALAETEVATLVDGDITVNVHFV